MKVVVLVAGTNEPSNANVLADAFIEGVRTVPGAQVEKIRLKDLSIKHFELQYYHPFCESEDDFCRLQEIVTAAHGIVIATPIWNFSVPAHLKNVIDRMGAFLLDEETRTKGRLQKTPCFFIFTGGAPLAVWKGVMRFTTSHLPESMRYYGGSVIGRSFEPKAMLGRGRFGLIVDQRPKSLANMRARGERFARIVDQFTRTGTLPLHFRVVNTLYRWGQRVVSKI